MSEADEVKTHQWKVPALAGAVVMVGLLAAAVVMAGGDSDDDADPADPSEQATAESSGCEIRVFLDRGITEEQRATLAEEIDALPDVASFRFVDQEATLAEAEALFADSPAMLDRVRSEPDLLLTSFRIVPATGGTDALQAMTDTLSSQAGVTRAAWGLTDGPAMSSAMSSAPGEVIVFLTQDVTEDQRVGTRVRAEIPCGS